jgi:Xaa-Pro dipeptidase
MDRCRAIKDHHEIACIRKANKISADAHRSVLQDLVDMTNEAQIQGLFEYTLTADHTKPAYSTIAGSGSNAGILHYSANNQPLRGRQLVCLDAGAMWKNYASDVTRTFPISGYFTPEAREIYALVELMQTSAIESLKPGVQMWDLHQRCHRLLIEGFLKLGILRGGSVDEIRKAGTSKGFLPHGLGHHLGLEVHDIMRQPILRYLPSGEAVRCEVPLSDPPRVFEQQATYKHLVETVLEPCTPKSPPLQEGMVVTIEPGIYFNRYELERAYLHTEPHCNYIDREVLDRYWEVGGVRIEDDLLITPHGYENLTTAAKGNEALELIRRGHDIY